MEWHRESHRKKEGVFSMNVAVLGAGSWGTALAKVLHDNGHTVTVWGRNADALRELSSGRNERYLPGVALPHEWTCEADLLRAAGGKDCIVIAIPSKGFREIAGQLRDSKA